jgi:hypothetical protein
MITDIENAIAEYLKTKLPARLTGTPHEIRAATDKRQPPGDRSLVIVRCEAAPSQGGGLVLAQVQIITSSPADIAAVTVASHATVERAVSECFSASDQADFNAAIAAGVTGKRGGGFFNEGNQPGSEGTAWQPYLSIVCGLSNAV